MPNMNPAVNIAGANISLDYDSGETKIVSSYGFEKIEYNDTTISVDFTMAEEGGDFDKNAFVVITPSKLAGSGQLFPSNSVCLPTSRVIPPEVGGSGRNRLSVRTYNLTGLGPGYPVMYLGKQDFTIVVQKLAPGYEAPEEEPAPLCPIQCVKGWTEGR